MQLSFTTLGCPNWDLATILTRAVEYGYDGVDFRGMGECIDITELPAFSIDLGQTRAQFKDAGLAVSCLSTSAVLVHAEDAPRSNSLEDLTRHCELAAGLGARIIRVFGGHNTEGMTNDDAFSSAADTLTQMVEIAEEYRVDVVVETHDRWVERELISSLLARVDHPRAGICWDAHHTMRLAGESAQESISAYGNYIRNIHLKDSTGSKDDFTYCMPGEGTIDFAATFSQLEQAGYDGWLTVEHEKRWYPQLEEPEEILPAFSQFLKKNWLV